MKFKNSIAFHTENKTENTKMLLESFPAQDQKLQMAP